MTPVRRRRPTLRPSAFTTAWSCLAIVWLLSATAAAAAQDTLPGTYAGDGIQVEIQAVGATYRGTITQAGQAYPFVAQGNAGRIEGTFQVGAGSFAFRASLQGDVLTLETGNSRYTLRRTATGGARFGGGSPTTGAGASASTSAFRAGTEMLYWVEGVFNSGPLGPGLQPTGGVTTGYDRVTVIAVEDGRCIILVTTFTRNPMDGLLFVDGSAVRVLSRAGGSCHYHTDPAVLAQMPDTQSANLIVGRGPYDHRGRQVEALTRGQSSTDEHLVATFDLETGHLLSFRGETGDLVRSGPDGQPTKPTHLNRMELERVRQRDTPWDVAAQLPPNVAALQGLHYRGVRYESYVGSADLPPLETSIDRRFGVRERGESWLLLETPPDPTPGQQAAVNVLAAGIGYFLPPAALARLQPGQVIDDDATLGLRMVVTHVDATTVVLSETMRSYHGHATYDRSTGLLIRLESEATDGSLITRTRLELVAAW